MSEKTNYPPFTATPEEIKHWQAIGETVKKLELEKPTTPPTIQTTTPSPKK